MTLEERDELLRDMREEAYQDERHEFMCRTDFEYFLNCNADLIDELNEANTKLRKQFELYNYDYDIKDLIY